MTDALIRILAPPPLATWLAQAYLRRAIGDPGHEVGARFVIDTECADGVAWRATVESPGRRTAVIETGVRGGRDSLTSDTTEVWVSPQGVLLARSGDRPQSGWSEVSPPQVSAIG